MANGSRVLIVLGRSRFRVPAVLAAFAAAWAVSPGPDPRAQATACPGADVPAASADAAIPAVLCLVNAERATAGARPLALNALLGRAAQDHADDMARRGYFDLNAPDGTTPFRRVRDAGYTGTAGAVIAFASTGSATPRDAVRRWLADVERRAIVLGRTPRDAGIGLATARGGRFGTGGRIHTLYTGRPAPPRPVAGKTAVVRTVSGTVTVQGPGGTPEPLEGSRFVPLGATIDATAGRVRLTVARSVGVNQTGEFYSGAVKVRQTRQARKGKRRRTYLTILRLTGGDFARACVATTARAAARRRKPVRRVWGNGKGSYRTEGRTGSATVRGTIWLTEDRCEGTYVRVISGSVRVRDRKRGRVVTVQAGQSILIRD